MAQDRGTLYPVGMTERHKDRAGDKVRAEAYRLAFAKTYPTAAEIEAHLVQSGWVDVSDALLAEHDRLNRIIAAKRSSQVGILGMFKDA